MRSSAASDVYKRQILLHPKKQNETELRGDYMMKLARYFLLSVKIYPMLRTALKKGK
jgi:hypothetical protein